MESKSAKREPGGIRLFPLDRFALRGLDFGIILVVAFAVGFWVYQRGNRAYEGILGRPLRVGIVAWPGYAGGLVANKGLRPNKDSYFWTQHKLLVEFVEQEDESQLLRDFADNKLDVIWSTVDSLAQQAPALQSRGIRPRAFMQVDWSRGGDAIIADAGIYQIEDLKTRRVAVSMSPSLWLLDFSLQSANIKPDEIERWPTTGSQHSAELFVNQKVDAAVLWEPDLTYALERRTGAHVLMDTSTATNLIADVMVAKKEFLDSHPEVIRAFVHGWLIHGTNEANKDPMLAVKVLKGERGFANVSEQRLQELLPTTYWANLNDNVKMFGLLDGKASFDDLFKQAGSLWLDRGYISQMVPAEEVRDNSALNVIYNEQQKLPGAICGTETPMLTITLTVPFRPNKADLSDETKSILDNQQALFILQTHPAASFCVQAGVLEGDSIPAIEITRAREKALIEYLISHYHRPPSQFVSASAETSQSLATTVRPKYIRIQVKPRGIAK